MKMASLLNGTNLRGWNNDAWNRRMHIEIDGGGGAIGIILIKTYKLYVGTTHNWLI